MSLALATSLTLTLRARPGAPGANHPVAGSSDVEHAAGLASVRVNSNDLLRGQKAVEINHNGPTYRLQVMRLGELILTK